MIPNAVGTLAESLPAELGAVSYVYERYPGAPGVAGVRDGANCQLYAYAVLEHFGLSVPPLRSSELWSDARLVTVTDGEEPLDIVFYNRTAEAFGAHLGIVVGANAVLHLGVPTTSSRRTTLSVSRRVASPPPDACADAEQSADR